MGFTKDYDLDAGILGTGGRHMVEEIQMCLTLKTNQRLRDHKIPKYIRRTGLTSISLKGSKATTASSSLITPRSLVKECGLG